MFDRLTPSVKTLLIGTIAVHFLVQLLPQQFVFGQFAFFNPFLANTEELLNPNFKIWQPVSYIFLHGSFGHLLSNMFGLFIFGPHLESFMGSNRFMKYYILTGVGAAILYSLFNYFQMTQLTAESEGIWIGALTPMVGASGAIFGILMAYGFLFPNVEMMLLFFPFPIKAKYFVTMYGLYELFQGTTGANSGVAHFAHLGGLAAGFILLKFFGFGKRFYH